MLLMRSIDIVDDERSRERLCASAITERIWSMRLFEPYRYQKPSPGPDVEHIDGYRNIFNVTRWPNWPGLKGAGRVQLDHGVDSVAKVTAIDGTRRPAILIASKPHQAGSDWTPWHDDLQRARGYVRYYGDNKASLGVDPWLTPGNRSLLAQFQLHRSPDRLARMLAAPLLVFESLVHEKRSKGFWRFIGLGLIDRIELVTQIDRNNRVFSNYLFDCTLVDLGPEGLQLPWNWIAARRDPTKSLTECLALAPEHWRDWVEKGDQARESIRQQIGRARIIDTAQQRPTVDSPAAAALGAVVDHYKKMGLYSGVGEHRFEGLASEMVGAALEPNGQYHRGWITRRAGDGGIDFVSRLDLGAGSLPLKLVVLGQAKCVSPHVATSGLDLARTVSRLDRGWVGAFVTTGHYSDQAQREVAVDRFPLLMLNGRDVGEYLAREAVIKGVTVPEYIQSVDALYESRLSNRAPAEILTD